MHVTYNGITFADVLGIATMTYEQWVIESANYWAGKKGREADLKRVWELANELVKKG